MTKYPVYHYSGCTNVAFFFLVEPSTGMVMYPYLVEYPDGTRPPDDDQTMALCGSCYEPLEIVDLSMRAPTRASS